ncbi:MAG: hypothetical protein AAGH90_11910 [Pseudomonadota bacterium]
MEWFAGLAANPVALSAVVAALVGALVTGLFALWLQKRDQSQQKLFAEETANLREKLQALELSQQERLKDFEGRAALRSLYIDICNEILEVGSRLVTPRDRDQFQTDWFALSDLFVGRGKLIPDTEFQKKFRAFANPIWSLTYDLSVDEDPEEMSEKRLKALADSVRNFFADEFSLENHKQVQTVMSQGRVTAAAEKRK